METGFICVGRNIEDFPMDQDRWSRYIKDLLHLLAKIKATVFAHAYGADSVEELFIVAFRCEVWDSIEAELALLAYIYEQKCISLTVGKTQLVTP